MRFSCAYATLLIFGLLGLGACDDQGGSEEKAGTVVVTPSMSGTVHTIVGGSQSLTLTFNSDDAHPVWDLVATAGLSPLPNGWSGPTNFSCATVGSGSGCVLTLTHAPTVVGSGSLKLVYRSRNKTGRISTGSTTIPYSSTSSNNVVGAASPTGQVNAVVGAGSQVLTVSFTTDDGNPATALSLTTHLVSLPSGWSSAASGFTCASVSTGNGCQLSLSYAPASVGSGTLTLNYSYLDNSGHAKTGNVNIAYASTSSNNIVLTPSPTGQIGVIVGGSQSVDLTFTTDDGNPATALAVTGLASLPSGWSGANSFSCSSVSTGNGCRLSLSYAPTAVGSGTLSLQFGYTNNSGVAKTGSAVISYVATTNNNVIGTASPAGQISVAAGASQGVSVTFTTDDGNAATALSVTTNLTALPSGWSSASSFNCSSVSTGNACQLSLTYAPSSAANSTLTLNFSYTNNAGIAKTGSLNIPYLATQSHLYVAQLVGPLKYCPINADGTIGTCAATGNGFSSPTGIVFNGNYAYVNDYYTDAVYVCNVASDGSLSGCVSTGSNFRLPWQLAISGSTLYATDAHFMYGYTTCTINSNGSLSGCTITSGSGTAGVAANANYAYISANGSTINVCAIGSGGSLSSCSATGSGFNSADGIALTSDKAYIANQGNGTVSTCSINVNGTLSACTTTSVGGAPTDVRIDGSHAYVDDRYGNIVLCNVASDGSLSGCAASNGGNSFYFGIQMAIH